jgi:hypothetical protein
VGRLEKIRFPFYLSRDKMKNYNITAEQRKEFLKNGFLRLPNALPVNILSKWKDLLTELNDNALKSYGKASSPLNTSFIDGPGNPLLTRVNDLLAVCPSEVLDLLACPAMIAIARDLCGPDSVPLSCDALFKHNHSESTVLWHQDAVHPRSFPYLNIGIYLDDADEGDGCVDYVKNSQHETLDICNLVKEHGWDLPNKVSMPVKAGDILIQDMMVLHGSQIKRKKGVRRTIYVEMRPAAAVLDQGVQSREWMELRRRWMAIVVRRSHVEWTETSDSKLPKDLKSDSEEIREILSLRESPIPANYCFESIRVSNYPN